MTAEEFWDYEHPDHLKCELVRGEVVCMPGPGPRHGQVAVKLSYLLTQTVLPRRLGFVMVETAYILERRPDTVRGPDVSFVAASRLPGDELPVRYQDMSPDLAVEVLSPDDRRKKVSGKVAEYLAAGSRLVWVIDPQRRVATIHAPDASPRQIDEHGTLDGADVVPGFSCVLRDALDW